MIFHPMITIFVCTPKVNTYGVNAVFRLKLQVSVGDTVITGLAVIVLNKNCNTVIFCGLITQSAPTY